MTQNNGWGQPPPGQQPQQQQFGQQPMQPQPQQQPQPQYQPQPGQQPVVMQPPQQQPYQQQQPQPQPYQQQQPQQQPYQQQPQGGAPQHNPFREIEGASDNSGGAWIDYGTISLLQFMEAKMVNSPKSGECFVTIWKVLVSNNTVKMPVGAEVSKTITMKHPSALSNVRRLCSAAFGVPFEQVDANRSFSILHPQSPAAGRVVLCDAHLILTQANKAPFTKTKWRAVEVHEAEAIGAQIVGGQLHPTPNDPTAFAIEEAKRAGQQPGQQVQPMQPQHQNFQQPQPQPMQPGPGQQGASHQQWGGQPQGGQPQGGWNNGQGGQGY